MMTYTLRFDDIQYRKLKIISAHFGLPLSKFMTKLFDTTIADWEKSHGLIDIPNE